jgi:trk system potassium uptake protein TrkA
MNIIICGAGEVGSHAAEVMSAAGTRITIVDTDRKRLRAVEDSMDVAVCAGNCAEASVLEEAGARQADLVVAATDQDEVNLLTASLGKGLGAAKSIARVHHTAFLDDHGFRYTDHLDIDRLICPEHATALAIARTLRNPGALAIEGFARGQIEMQEFTASKSGSAVGKRLADVKMPAGSRLALVRRKGDEPDIPKATTVVVPGDSVILVGNTEAFPTARRLFHDDKQQRRRLVIMGGTPMAVWLCRSLRDRNFAIRLFETDRERAEVLAEKLSWVTVLQADPTDRGIFDEEDLSQADVFVALRDDDEANIISAVLAKLRGVTLVINVVQQSKYLDMIYDIGVDRAFSPRIVAANEIESVLDDRPLRHLGSLAEGVVDVYRIKVGPKSHVIGTPLRDLGLTPDWVVAAIQRGRETHVPGADDLIETEDVVLVVGKRDEDARLRKLFAVGKE